MAGNPSWMGTVEPEDKALLIRGDPAAMLGPEALMTTETSDDELTVVVVEFRTRPPLPLMAAIWAMDDDDAGWGPKPIADGGGGGGEGGWSGCRVDVSKGSTAPRADDDDEDDGVVDWKPPAPPRSISWRRLSMWVTPYVLANEICSIICHVMDWRLGRVRRISPNLPRVSYCLSFM